MPILATQYFKDLARPANQGFANNYTLIYGTQFYSKPSYNLSVLFRQDARILINKLKTLFPNRYDVQVKFEQLFTGNEAGGGYFSEAYQQPKDIQNIEELKHQLENIFFKVKTGLEQGKSQDDFAAMQ